MLKSLPTAYVLSKFLVYSFDPTYRQSDGIYNAGCPICKEGKSLGKKKRLFYYPQSNSFYCWNCSKNWSALDWLSKVTGLNKEELLGEAKMGEYSTDIHQRNNGFKTPKKRTLPSLPYDCINLSDPQQEKYWQNNSVYVDTINYIKRRRLDTAINRPTNYYLSLTDYIHKNRLIIPYVDDKKIVFYQSRAIDDSEPRYLNKIGYDKTVFGIERINPNIDHLFITEGPTDSMFIENGVCLAGLVMTKAQKKQLARFPLMVPIWILDNPKYDSQDKAVEKKIIQLLEDRQKVFKWPNVPYKDLNELAVTKGIDRIPLDFILQNLYS